ncbi:hypothetical protein VaNZ11_011806 [Volvox africanus]|uniref:HNH nuclease domain-containing protein n=1 Tax=Volvox africanus TaxID=51714 RepID=A0ABQ5SCE4_9CHLO|nr:hypothetical protein VaNZ11_011806 [Volvox africanus]
MALEDKAAAGARILELYRDDPDMGTKLFADIFHLDAAKFTDFRNMWMVAMGLPTEKQVLERILSGMAAGPGPGDMMSTLDMIRQEVKAAAELAANNNQLIRQEVKAAAELAANNNQLIRKLVRKYYDMSLTPRCSSSRYAACRRDALAYYTGSQEEPPSIVCAVSGVCLPAKEVNAGHIYQLRWIMLDHLDLDCNAPTNILFMQKKIEAAFDNFEITVLPVHHKVFLLKRSLSNHVAFEYRADADMTAAGGSTSSGKKAELKKVIWGELHQKKLSVAGINQPSDVALFVHAQRAFRFAVQRGWVKSSEVPALCYGDNEILRRFLADADSTSSGSGAGGDQGATTGSDLGESSQLPESEGVGDV